MNSKTIEQRLLELEDWKRDIEQGWVNVCDCKKEKKKNIVKEANNK